MFKYRGYFGSIEHSTEDMTLHGKIECIADIVTYEAETMHDLKSAFEAAVDDYLETCKLLNKNPDKPMSGTFNIRIGEELHKAAYLHAKKLKLSLNDLVKKAIEEKLITKNEFHLHFNKELNFREQPKYNVIPINNGWAGEIKRGVRH